MIQRISIKNFKSIKEIEFSAKRINLFIGKPNTGKSNLLEAIGAFSIPYTSQIKSLIRLERAIDLFYDNQTSQKIEIKADNFNWEAFPEGNMIRINGKSEVMLFDLLIDINGDVVQRSYSEVRPPFKFYRFTSLTQFLRKEFDFLLPPSGENLLVILSSKDEIYKLVDSLLQEYGLKIIFEEAESKIKILKQVTPKPVLHPYSTISDTFQRIIFHLAAIKSNKDSVLLFEEPEAHAFPYYVKLLAESIALDTSGNQYFISTHNPYLLLSILEKSSKEDVAIFITYFKEYQTKVKELSENEKQKILDHPEAVFFMIDEFLQQL
jgi:AAA15 family ATPase/GTPase